MNRYKATLILIITAIGFLLAYPYEATFLGGLLSSGFCSAMIGGFADWYGVTALFRKPLGIPIKTNIISKNRENIFYALSKMVGEELLTKSFIRELIDEHNLSKLILEYTSKEEKKEKLLPAINFIIVDIIKKFDAQRAARGLTVTIEDVLWQANIVKVMISTMEVTLKSEYYDKILDFALFRFSDIVKSQEFYKILLSLVENAKNTYEKGSKRRAFVNNILLNFFLQLSSESIAAIIQIKSSDYLLNLRTLDNSDRLRLKAYLEDKIMKLKEDQHSQEAMRQWIRNHFESNSFYSYFLHLFDNFKEQFYDNEHGSQKIFTQVLIVIDDLSNKLSSNKEYQWMLDVQLKNVLYKLVDKFHGNIELLVRENLNKYNDKELVKLIEDKAGNDLQLIRINGSIVGGLVGMTIFIITFLLK